MSEDPQDRDQGDDGSAAQPPGASATVAPAAGRRTRRIIWLTVAVLATILSFFLSWPWWRDFSYWPESRTMWAIYFAVGFVLAIYVFYTFFGNLRTLFEHDAIERAEIEARTEAGAAEDRS